MPNIASRFKSNTLVKDEKENENKDIKRKLNTAPKNKPTSKPQYVVWRRATNVKRSFSNEALLTTNTRVRSKSSYRLPKSIKIPLSPSLAANRHVAEKMLRTAVMPEKQTELVYPCEPVTSVEEIMTARSICNSKSSSDESKCASRNFEESMDDFEMASLMLSPSREYSNCSTIIANNFRDVLKRRAKMMNPEEIKIIKDLVKTDGRYRKLEKKDDDELFKDILKTQLQEILKQESVVKSALQKLDTSSVDTNMPETIVVGESLALDDSTMTTRPRVDVIFKNVPTLEKEIIILKALGEKLEATLKRTMSERNVISQVFDRPAEMVRSYYFQYTHNAQIIVRPMGVKGVLGFVHEFTIAKKTLADLKNDAKRHFYLPTNNEQTELRRTTFKRLKDKPVELMRHLKANNSLVRFNVLDQDPMFFNSFLFNKPYSGDDIDGDSSETDENYVVSMREAGDHPLVKTAPYYKLEPLKIEEIRYPNEHETDNETCKVLTNRSVSVSKEFKKVTIKKSVKVKPQPIPLEAPIRGKQRRRIRRLVSPLPLDKYIEPKNHLLKTILVGSMQISVFLLLIMAITYPDLKC